jgi:hypothetical protein
MDTYGRTIIVSVKDAFQSIDGLPLVPGTLGLHYTSVKQGCIFGGAPTNVIQTLRGCCGQYLAAAILRRVLTKFHVSAVKPYFVHQIACDWLVSSTVRHFSVSFSSSGVILSRQRALDELPVLYQSVFAQLFIGRLPCDSGLVLCSGFVENQMQA